MKTRRDHLLQLGGVAVNGCLGLLIQRTVIGAAIPALKALAAQKGLLFGTCSDTNLRLHPAYGKLITSQCALFAPQLGWRGVSPTPSALINPDPNVTYATERGLKLTGYHLLWHQTTPRWFLEIKGASPAETAVNRHIRDMAGQYGKNSYSWNVVNEALEPKEGRKDALRNESPFLKQLGPDFIDMSFRAAFEYAPDVTRVYNEYGLESDTPEQETRRSSVLRLIDGLLKRGTPIEALGLQSHLKLQSPFDQTRYRRFLKEVSSRGLKILLTEVDVSDLGAPSDIARRDQMVADMYSRFLEAALDEPATKALVTWGLSDRYTWLAPTFDKAFGRSDGMPQRPLPFDLAMAPKPAFYAIVNALRSAPNRSSG